MRLLTLAACHAAPQRWGGPRIQVALGLEGHQVSGCSTPGNSVAQEKIRTRRIAHAPPRPMRVRAPTARACAHGARAHTTNVTQPPPASLRCNVRAVRSAARSIAKVWGEKAAPCMHLI